MVAAVVGLYSAVDLYFGPFYPPAGPVAAEFIGPESTGRAPVCEDWTEMVDWAGMRGLRGNHPGGHAADLDAPGSHLHRRRAGTLFHSVYAGVSAGAPQWKAYLEPPGGAGTTVRRSGGTAAYGCLSDQGSTDLIKRIKV